MSLLIAYFYHATSSFRVNLNLLIASMLRNFLFKTGEISKIYVTAIGFEPTVTQFVHKYSTIYRNWLDD